MTWCYRCGRICETEFSQLGERRSKTKAVYPTFCKRCQRILERYPDLWDIEIEKMEMHQKEIADLMRQDYPEEFNDGQT